MGCLLNILWHFPFMGFLFALFYALGGLIMCCTIILIPIGLGWLQFARFLLSPFSCAMVSRSDLERLTGEKQNSAMATFSLVIRILYFPFGCIAAFFMIFTIAFEFLSIIGIPCGMVWAKSFGTIFNPVNKVCVPKAVADEIERMKSADTLSKYTGRSSRGNDGSQSADVARLVSVLEQRERVHEAEQRPQVRMFDDAHLQEIVDNPEMYNAELVAQSRREIEIRRKSESLKEKVAGFDDGKLREVISSSGMYAEELIYCCQQEFDCREQLYREEEERALEQARIEREQEAAAERERRMLWWKKWRVPVCSAVALVVIAICAAVGISVHVKRERMRQEIFRLEQERRAEMDRKLQEEQRQLEEQRRKEREKQEAETRRREQQRQEAERLKQEEKKILAGESYRRSVGAYLVGEYHEKLNGIVFWVDKTYKHGKVISVAEMPRNYFDGAKLWCNSLGGGKWRLPTIEEWKSLTKDIKHDSRLGLRKEGENGYVAYYWSSSQETGGRYWICYPYGYCSAEKPNSTKAYARAVCEF